MSDHAIEPPRSEARKDRRLLRYVFSGEEAFDTDAPATKRSFIVTDVGEKLNVATILHGQRAAGSNLDRQQVEALKSACEGWLSKHRNGHGP